MVVSGLAWHLTQLISFSEEYEEETHSTHQVHDKGKI